MPGDAKGVLPLGHPTGILGLPIAALSCQALLLLCSDHGEADAWPLPVPKGSMLLELHIKWPESETVAAVAASQTGGGELRMALESYDRH
jgi:hypothetical protein